MKKFFLYSIIGLLLFVPGVSQAQGIKNAGTPLETVGAKAGTDDIKDLESVVGRVINTALQLVGMIFLILMVYAGYLWMTARGEETHIDQAKKIITASIIGLVIVMSAYAITYLITQRVEKGVNPPTAGP